MYFPRHTVTAIAAAAMLAPSQPALAADNIPFFTRADIPTHITGECSYTYCAPHMEIDRKWVDTVWAMPDLPNDPPTVTNQTAWEGVAYQQVGYALFGHNNASPVSVAQPWTFTHPFSHETVQYPVIVPGRQLVTPTQPVHQHQAGTTSLATYDYCTDCYHTNIGAFYTPTGVPGVDSITINSTTDPTRPHRAVIAIPPTLPEGQYTLTLSPKPGVVGADHDQPQPIPPMIINVTAAAPDTPGGNPPGGNNGNNSGGSSNGGGSGNGGGQSAPPPTSNTPGTGSGNQPGGNGNRPGSGNNSTPGGNHTPGNGSRPPATACPTIPGGTNQPLPAFTTLAGETRHHTTVNTMAAIYGPGKQFTTAYLSRDDNSVDAQGAIPLAVRDHAPIVQTNPTIFSPRTRGFLRDRVQPGGTVIILGGYQAVSPTIEADIQAMGYRTVRYGGATRVETLEAMRVASGMPTLKITNLDDPTILRAAIHGNAMSYLAGSPIPQTPVDTTGHIKPGDRVTGLYYTAVAMLRRTCTP